MLSQFIMLALLIAAAFCLTSQTQSILALQENPRALTSPLEVIQVERPLRSSSDKPVCEQVIVQHNFAASYGNPYVAIYEPLQNCSWTSVIFNLTITSNGTNYDRLALLFLSDIEVWRFSTAMPTRAGIYSSFQKDMTIYTTLLNHPQQLILSLDNIYNDVFTGAFNITIASLYFDDNYSSSLTPAPLILPLSSNSSPPVFSLPDNDASVSLTFPRNSKNAVVSILATGNGDEEFWYRKGVPNEYVDTFNNTQLHGFSPFREIQLSIDGNLAGVSWPFPIVFTGGINPGLWRPILGIDVYDIPSFEIDISPWLGILSDGVEHVFNLKANGFDTEGEEGLGTVGENWWVTGSVFIWVDESGNQTTGGPPIVSTPSPTFTLQPNLTISTTNTSTTTNESLWISLQGHRTLSISSNITTSDGSQPLFWNQVLTYRNVQNLTAAGYNNALSQLTTGHSSFSSGNNSFSYPIEAYTVSKLPNSTTSNISYLLGSIDRSLITSGVSILPLLSGINTKTEELSTRQNGSCVYYWDNVYYEGAGAIDPQAGSVGATDQWYSYSGDGVEYGRIIKAHDGLDDYEGVVSDEVFGHTIDVPKTVKVAGEIL